MPIARFAMTLLLGLLLACAVPDDDLPQRAAATDQGGEPSVPLHARHSPLRVQLLGPAQPRQGDVVQLVLKLDRAHGQLADGSVALRLPAGVTLLDDDGHKSRLALPQLQHGELTYSVRLDEMPSEDLFVEVDARGAGWGYHTRLPYRFGRPAPVSQGPHRTGRAVRVGARDLGPAIEMP